MGIYTDNLFDVVPKEEALEEFAHNIVDTATDYFKCGAKLFHFRKEMVDENTGHVIGHVIVSMLIDQENKINQVLDVDIAFLSEKRVTLFPGKRLGDDGPGFRYYGAWYYGISEQTLWFEAVNSFTQKADLEGEKVTASISLYPREVTVYSSMEELNEAYGMNKEISHPGLNQMGILSIGYNDQFLAVIEGYNKMIGTVLKCRDVRVNTAPLTMEFTLAEVRTAFGTVPVALREKIAPGDVLDMSTIIVADLADPERFIRTDMGVSFERFADRSIVSPERYKNFGLDYLLEDPQMEEKFIFHLMMNGEKKFGYYKRPYYYANLGKTEYWIHTREREDGITEVTHVDIHEGNMCVWDLAYTGIDISTDDEAETGRVLMMKNGEDGKGMIPIHFINPDVLPGLQEDDRVKLQVIALPLWIEYFKDEDSYFDSIPPNKNGKRLSVNIGGMEAVRFLLNHHDGKPECGIQSDDDVVEFYATFLGMKEGETLLDGQTVSKYLRCIAKTKFGEIEFLHPYSMLPEDKSIIQPGAVVHGECVISGDVAIYEYEQGAVYDYDHELSLLRCVMGGDNVERLSGALAKDAVMETQTFGERLEGKQAVMDRFEEVIKNRTTPYKVHFAEISDTEMDDPQYTIGTRCLVLESEESGYESIVFMKTDSENKISHIHIVNDNRYRFCLN